MSHRPVYKIVLVMAIGAAVIAGLFFGQAVIRRTTLQGFLTVLWSDYKQHDWDPVAGRTIDGQNGGVTTSEGQAYTMLRAVWMDDRPAFALTWQWTQANLQRADALFRWRWDPSGKTSNDNTASDADTDLALALLLAAGRWHDNSYMAAARTIIPSIWQNEVVLVRGQPYLTADNVEKDNQKQVVINPSYLAPYAYSGFASVDPAHNWHGLAASSYDVINQSSVAALDTKTSADLPPNWVVMNRVTGQLRASSDRQQNTDFGFDALRVIWRVALDSQWSHQPVSVQTVKQSDFLDQSWHANHRLFAIYAHDGQPKADYESYALYGGTLGHFIVINRSAADSIVNDKLLTLYDGKKLVKTLSYYDNNWVWFGLALYADKLPNFTGGGGV